MFWVIFTIIIGSLFAPKFIQSTNNDFTAPANSDSAKAKKLVAQYFSDKLNNDNHIILLEKQNGTIDVNVLDTFTAELVNNTKNIEGFNQISGYTIFKNTPLDFVKDQYISKDGSVSIIIISITGNSDQQQSTAEQIRLLVKQYSPKGYNTYVTGIGELSIDTD